MNQNQSHQTTTPSENNNIEQVDEQELQEISGGLCLSCGVVAAVAKSLGNNAIAKAHQTRSLKDMQKIADYGFVYMRTAPHISEQIKPCENCIGGAKGLVKTILDGGK